MEWTVFDDIVGQLRLAVDISEGRQDGVWGRGVRKDSWRMVWRNPKTDSSNVQVTQESRYPIGPNYALCYRAVSLVLPPQPWDRTTS